MTRDANVHVQTHTHSSFLLLLLFTGTLSVVTSSTCPLSSQQYIVLHVVSGASVFSSISIFSYFISAVALDVNWVIIDSACEFLGPPLATT